ncbi:MAG: hypothetical protein NZ805_05950 [Armatimonadetes bacterium]|nr:hypothetical protein [Armatimonadota bacterium]MDW8029582.1 hypothetical protein [Armatimonadota bacterium]
MKEVLKPSVTTPDAFKVSGKSTGQSNALKTLGFIVGADEDRETLN